MSSGNIQTFDWVLSSFSQKYFPEETGDVNGVGRLLVAPSRLKPPYPTCFSPLLLFGNVRGQWKIGLTAKEVIVSGRPTEQWSFELQVILADIKRSGSGLGLGNSSLEYRPVTSADVDVNFKARVSFLSPLGFSNLTVFDTPFAMHRLQQNVKVVLGWPRGLPGPSHAKNIIENQLKFVGLNNTVRARVHIEYCGPNAKISRLDLNLPEPNSEELMLGLLSDMEKVLESGTGSDVTIQCGLETYRAHKTMLSIRSPVFQAMFQSDMEEARSGVIIIDDFEPSIIKHLLRFMYTTKLDLHSMANDEIMGLVKAGEKYQIQTLKDYCFASLLKNIHEDTCAEAAVFAYLTQASIRHRSVIFNFISEHWSSLAAKKEFQEMVKMHPEAFFKPKD